MMTYRVSVALISALVVSSGTAAAQRSQASLDSASRVQIRNVLRAFYFNSAHGDWNALLTDMLGSKVDANRNAPFEAIVASDTPASDAPISCLPTPPIDRAVIVLRGNWAHVSVPRCGASDSAADQFRMIRLEERWRFVDFRVLDTSH